MVTGVVRVAIVEIGIGIFIKLTHHRIRLRRDDDKIIHDIIVADCAAFGGVK